MSRRGAQTVTINKDSVMASSGLESRGKARQSRRRKVSSAMERLGLFGKGSHGKEQLKGRKGKETK